MAGYPNTLIYFMWPWQVYFRISCQTSAESLFNQLDPNLNPYAFLIGFRLNEREDRLPICVDPEDLHYSVDEFLNIKQLADEIAETHEDSKLFYTGPGVQEEMDERFDNEMFRLAIMQKLNGSAHENNRICFVSSGVTVDDYKVFAILEMDKTVFESHQHLETTKYKGQHRIYRSLVEATIKVYLTEKEQSLKLPNPGKRMIGDSRPSSELLREAAEDFMFSISIKGDEFHGLHGLNLRCEELSTTQYENSENTGHLIISRKDHPDILMTLELEHPFTLHQYRKVRKMLELSNEEVGVICNSYQILGLGIIQPSYDLADESIFRIVFKGIHCWEVFHQETSVMDMRYGLPQLSKSSINEEKFKSDAKRLFSKITDDQVDYLYLLAVSASKQKRGAMIVISDDAAHEAQRFGKRCINIKPIRLTEALVLNLTSIDGAVLIDLNGTAYAKGVILDGIVGSHGDAGRGSRYNSALTYCEYRGFSKPTLVVVVSEDGMVDILPALRPQIRHSEILQMISFLESLNSEATFDRSAFYKSMEWFKNREFYLNTEECARINQLKNDLVALDRKLSQNMWVAHEDLHPNAEMSERYYLVEEQNKP